MDKLKDKLLLISAVQCNINEDSFDILRNHTLKNGFNVEQLNHLFKDGFQGEFIEEKHGNVLKKYLEEAHANGLKVIVYFCLHELFESDKTEHPDWIQRTKTGDYIGAYGSHYLACLNSSWREYSLKRIKALCRYDIDGIFLDGPVIALNGCYCDACKKLFKERVGKDYANATLNEFLTFRTDCLTDFVKDIREAADSVKEGVLIYLNNSALRADVTGSNTRRLFPYVDMIGAEGGFSSATGESLYLPGLMAKEIEMKAEGKPTVIFTAGDRKPHSFAMHTAADTVRMLAQTVVNGANVWYGLHGFTSQMNSAGGQAAKAFMEYLKDHEEIYVGTKSAANVAVVWSVETANYYSSKISASDFTGDETNIGKAEDKGDHFEEFIGWCEMLSQLHIGFDVVDERGFIRNKDKYELIVLPAVACMSDRFAESIEQFVSEGGKAVASLVCGDYDENGNPRKGGLGDLFGLTLGETKREWPGTVYQMFEDEDVLKVAPPMFRIAETDSAQILASRFGTMSGRYEKPTEKEAPSVTKNICKNGEAIFFLNNVGQDYIAFRSEDYFEAVNKFVPVSSAVLTDAPRGVEITLRAKGDRYIAHLVNLTGNKGPMTEVPTVKRIRLNLAERLGRVKKAYTPDGKALAFDGKYYTLEDLGNYGCVVFEVD